MNKTEKIVADRYESRGFKVIKSGMPDLIAIKDHGYYWELIFDEVKTNRLPLQENQKRAIALLRRLEGKPIRVTVKMSRILTEPAQSTPTQSRPNHARPCLSKPAHSSPRQSIPDHTDLRGGGD